MGLNKDKLIFNPSKLSCSDNVGAYLRDDQGNLLTSTLVGSSQALDVNLVNPIPVETDLDGIYNVTTNADPDNVGAIYHSRAASPGDAEQTFRSTGAKPDSDNLDPANIHALDVNSFLMGWDGTGWDRITSTDGNLDVKIDDSTPVNVAITGQPIEVRECYDSFNAQAVSVDDTVGGTQVKATALTDRCSMIIQNLGDCPVYLGANGVTAATGVCIPGGASLEFKAGDGADYYLISEAGETNDIRILEQA